MKITIEKILSIPKSFYVSFRLFPLRQALLMPAMVRYNTKILSVKGSIKVNSPGGAITAMFKVGFGKIGVFDKTYERSMLEISGTILLSGKAYVGHGSRICVTRNGRLSIGNNFCNTAMTTIVCDRQIVIGNNVLVSWNTLIMDTDWHAIQKTDIGGVCDYRKPITIGDNVWLCTRSVILKGSEIADGCIVGANSIVSKRFTTANTLIAGNPAVEKRHNVTRVIE